MAKPTDPGAHGRARAEQASQNKSDRRGPAEYAETGTKRPEGDTYPEQNRNKESPDHTVPQTENAENLLRDQQTPAAPQEGMPDVPKAEGAVYEGGDAEEDEYEGEIEDDDDRIAEESGDNPEEEEKE